MNPFICKTCEHKSIIHDFNSWSSQPSTCNFYDKELGHCKCTKFIISEK